MSEEDRKKLPKNSNFTVEESWIKQYNKDAKNGLYDSVLTEEDAKKKDPDDSNRHRATSHGAWLDTNDVRRTNRTSTTMADQARWEGMPSAI